MLHRHQQFSSNLKLWAAESFCRLVRLRNHLRDAYCMNHRLRGSKVRAISQFLSVIWTVPNWTVSLVTSLIPSMFPTIVCFTLSHLWRFSHSADVTIQPFGFLSSAGEPLVGESSVGESEIPVIFAKLSSVKIVIGFRSLTTSSMTSLISSISVLPPVASVISSTFFKRFEASDWSG